MKAFIQKAAKHGAFKYWTVKTFIPAHHSNTYSNVDQSHCSDRTFWIFRQVICKRVSSEGFEMKSIKILNISYSQVRLWLEWFLHKLFKIGVLEYMFLLCFKNSTLQHAFVVSLVVFAVVHTRYICDRKETPSNSLGVITFTHDWPLRNFILTDEETLVTVSEVKLRVIYGFWHQKLFHHLP